MAAYLFEPNQPVSIPITNSETRFPINRIFCIGRNYMAHAQEMGFTVDKENDPAFYFIKDPQTYVPTGSTLTYPPMTTNYHYEMELALCIDKPGFEVSLEEADTMIYGYMAALDMTRRDLQATARDSGKPWDFSKNFEESCVLSDIVPKDNVGSVEAVSLSLQVNGETKQDSNTKHLIWNVQEIVADLSRYYHLQPGDVILTGTPDGIGPVKPGDKITGQVQNVATVTATIAT